MSRLRTGYSRKVRTPSECVIYTGESAAAIVAEQNALNASRHPNGKPAIAEAYSILALSRIASADYYDDSEESEAIDDPTDDSEYAYLLNAFLYAEASR